MAKSKTQKHNEPKLRFTVRHALTDIYVILMFTLFPLLLTNQYANARRDKFWTFLIITFVTGVVIAILTASDLITRNSVYEKKLNTYRDPFKLNITDYAFFAFVGISLISTLTSDRIGHCILGLTYSNTSTGRNMGLLSILIILMCYFIISRFFFIKKYVFYAIFAGITIVTVLAILNYYYIDPVGIFKGYDAKTIENFTSTLGNKNYLSAFICIALPFSVGIAMTTKDKLMLIVANISTSIQFMGLLVATSDGGFLGLTVTLLVVLIIISRKPLLLAKLFFSISVMMASAVLLKLFDLIMKEKSKGYTSFSSIFMSLPVSLILLVIFAALTALFAFFTIKRGDAPFPEFVFFMVLGVVILGALALISSIIYYSCINTTETLTGMKKYLRFDENWGTHRGFFWIKSLEIWWNDLNIWEKLFGTGPDTFYYACEPYFGELWQKYGEGSTNAAHNVYLNYLVTQGILGLSAYLTFIGSSIYLSVKRSENPLAFMCLMVIVTYAVQDIVNIANPVNTPLFFIFIALSESTRLKANSNQQLNAVGY